MKSFRNNIIFWLIIFLLVSITALGLTYAYFTTVLKKNTNESSVVITAGKLELTYYDGNNTVILENMKPDSTVDTKTFSVKNTGKSVTNNYGVYLEDVINELYFYSDLDYTLSCKEYDNNDNYVRDCNGNSEDFPTIDSLLISNSLNVGYSHEYEFAVKYVESNKNQSIDMNKKISGKIQIYDLNDIVDINGVVTNYMVGDYLTLSGSNKNYKIGSDGRFVIPALEPKNYTMSINSIDGVYKWNVSFEIIKGKVFSVSDSKDIITINNSSNIINMDITKGDTQNIILNSVSLND